MTQNNVKVSTKGRSGSSFGDNPQQEVRSYNEPCQVPTEMVPHGRRTRSSKLQIRRNLLGWSFILPNFIGFFIFTMIPVIALFYYGFTKWSPLGDATFTGLANFQRLIGDHQFWVSIVNTVYYAVFTVPLTYCAALGLAMLLNRKLKALSLFRAVAFFPYITSIVAIAAVWNALFSPEFGPFNAFLRLVGVSDPPGWTTSTTWAMPAVILVSIWRGMGYYMLLLLAGLQTVPREYYEASLVDGASKWQQFLHITMPCLRPTTFFVVVMLTMDAFKVFDLILVMTQGGPGTSTLVISQFIYRKGFEEGNFGYASAASIVLFFICLILTVCQYLYNNRKER